MKYIKQFENFEIENMVFNLNIDVNKYNKYGEYIIKY